MGSTGLTGVPSDAREVGRRQVVEEDAGAVAEGDGGHEHLVAERAPGELGLDVLAGEEPRHADAAAEPVIGDRRQAHASGPPRARVEERAQARGEHLARDHGHRAGRGEPRGQRRAARGEAVVEAPHEADAVLDDGEALVGARPAAAATPAWRYSSSAAQTKRVPSEARNSPLPVLDRRRRGRAPRRR